MNKELIKNTLLDAQSALAPFAEPPSDMMDTYPCHSGICSKWQCVRCYRAIHAYGAMMSIDYALAELEK
jgi:hypothetical protein